MHPNCIPERVFIDTADEPGSDGIAHDVPGHVLQVFLPTHGVIVKSDLPNLTTASPNTTDLERTPAFDRSDHSAEVVTGVKLHEPMQVIRHDDVGER
jgi:hypothetical protein